MTKSTWRGVRRWLWALLALALVASGSVATVAVTRAMPGLLPLASEAESSNSQIVSSITREKEVVLLSLAIQGIASKRTDSTFFGVKVPGSERSTFLQYSFNAKIGIDGDDVVVTRTGDSTYEVSIPKFIFIGHSNESFQIAAEGNGAVSWITPEIDSVEMINNLLNDETQQQYITQNKAVLQDQAKAFYTGIIAAVDPAVTVTVSFND